MSHHGLGDHAHPYANMVAEERPIEIVFTPPMVRMIRSALTYAFAPRWPGKNTDRCWYTPGNRTRIIGNYVTHNGQATVADHAFLEGVRDALRAGLALKRKHSLHPSTRRAIKVRLRQLDELMGVDAITRLGEVDVGDPG